MITAFKEAMSYHAQFLLMAGIGWVMGMKTFPEIMAFALFCLCFVCTPIRVGFWMAEEEVLE